MIEIIGLILGVFGGMLLSTWLRSKREEKQLDVFIKVQKECAERRRVRRINHLNQRIQRYKRSEK